MARYLAYRPLSRSLHLVGGVGSFILSPIRAELAKLLNISQSQMGHITNAPAGHGLLRVGGSIVPFANDFPRDGELYRPWSTTPGDK